MAKLLRVYKPDGTATAIWNDATSQILRKAGSVPKRASRVEAIDSGPHRGKFYVDMTLLATLAEDTSLEVCLVQTFENYADAITAELQFIRANWLFCLAQGDDDGTVRAGNNCEVV
jgi:hypothetical protein